MSSTVDSSKPIADLSKVERIRVTFITRNRSYLPSWSRETIFPTTASNEPRTDCIVEHLHGTISIKGLFEWLGGHFVVFSGYYRLNDSVAEKNGKFHRLHLRFLPKSSEDGHSLEDLRVFYKHPWGVVRVRVDKEGKWLSVFCTRRLQNQRPSLSLRMEQDQLQLDHMVHSAPPWWKEKNRRQKAKKQATAQASPPP